MNLRPLLHWQVNSLDHHGRLALCPFPSVSPSPSLLLLPNIFQFCSEALLSWTTKSKQ